MSVFSVPPSRREVLAALSGFTGLVLATTVLPSCGSGPRPAAAPEPPGDPSQHWEPNLFLAIDGMGAITIVAHRSEMGTGIRTTLPMVLADELGADWSRVTVVQAVGDRRLGSQNTDGSRSIRDFLTPLRQMGASARTLLERAAAAQWKVDPKTCRADLGRVNHEASGRSLPFGLLVAAAAALPVPAESEVTLRPLSELRYLGHGVPIVDRSDLLKGSGTFGLDVFRPDLQVAVIARSPVLGGRLLSHDADAARAVPGVLSVVLLPDFQGPHGFQPLGGVAVLASNTWAALKGREALNAQWEPGANGSYSSDSYGQTLVAEVQSPGKVVRERGDVDAALAAADRLLSITYETPLLAHAPMEPPCAVASVSEGHCEVWAPTQNPQAAQSQVANSLGLDPSAVTVHVTLLGGGFGRKSKPDMAAEAALLSAQVGAPVKVVWTREDDIRHDYYHACAAVHLGAALDAAGRPTAWIGRSAFPSISSTFAPGVREGSSGELSLGFTDVPFAVPNLRVEVCKADAHVRIGWLRSVCNVFHAFAVGSFADELAEARGMDPLDNLMDLLGPDLLLDPGAEGAEYGNYGESLDDHPIDTGRLAAVAQLAAEHAGWGQRLPRGSGLGIAAHRSFLSYVAVVARVDVSRSGKISLPRVDIALDCGLAVHPDRVRAQMEGSVVFGAGIALHSAITAKDGVIEQGNFNDYRVPRMGEAPREIHVHLVTRQSAPGGVGEPGVPPVAPAICNAVFAATGQRVRKLPLSDHDLSWS